MVIWRPLGYTVHGWMFQWTECTVCCTRFNSLGLMLSALCMLLCISYEESIGSFLVATSILLGRKYLYPFVFYFTPCLGPRNFFVKKPMALNVLTQETLQ
uniref:Uncharacterized protein n=1 Tax=Cacopsylla melanoneura TaxID=428564 RepID=A0A8D8UF47_9HEMI